MKKLKIALLILAIIVVGLFSYDKLIGQKADPKFYEGCPSEFLSRLFTGVPSAPIGINLPPLGIWLCPEYYNDQALRVHELAHWDQYKRMSTLGFYLRYFGSYVLSGFNYEKNWMEMEAEEKEAAWLSQ